MLDIAGFADVYSNVMSTRRLLCILSAANLISAPQLPGSVWMVDCAPRVFKKAIHKQIGTVRLH